MLVWPTRLPWLGLLVLAALLVAVGAADATTHGSGSIFSPGTTHGPWHWSWLIAVSTSFFLYAAGIFRLRRTGQKLVAVFVVAAAIQLTPLLGPLLLSSDAYSYWDLGRVAAVHGGNPYSDSPSKFPDDPAFRVVGLTMPTIYGPTFTEFSELHARIAGTSPFRAAFLYRLAAAIGLILLLLVATSAATDKTFAVAFIGWNPLLALHFAGGGHNDVWWLLLALGGVALVRHSRTGLGGAAWAVSATVKPAPLLLAPLELLALFRRNRDRRAVRSFVVGFLVAIVVAAAVATALYGTAWLREFHGAATLVNQTSSLSSVFRLGKLGIGTKHAQHLLELLFLAGYARLTWDAWRGRARLGLASSLVILTPAWLMPWYGSWPVVFSAVEDDFAAQLVAMAATAYLLSDAVPLPFSMPF